jgi:hypothetical protein
MKRRTPSGCLDVEQGFVGLVLAYRELLGKKIFPKKTKNFTPLSADQCEIVRDRTLELGPAAAAVRERCQKSFTQAFSLLT